MSYEVVTPSKMYNGKVGERGPRGDIGPTGPKGDKGVEGKPSKQTHVDISPVSRLDMDLVFMTAVSGGDVVGNGKFSRFISVNSVIYSLSATLQHTALENNRDFSASYAKLPPEFGSGTTLINSARMSNDQLGCYDFSVVMRSGSRYLVCYYYGSGGNGRIDTIIQ